MNSDRSSRCRAGVTLVELMVVIAIIAVLMALLFPAVQSAREAARTIHCRNNLKQLAYALQQYHAANQVFPPSSTWKVDPTFASRDGLFSENWVITILPQLEQQPLRDLFDTSVYLSADGAAASNRTARGTWLPVMLCPTDGFNRRPFNGSANSKTTKMGDGWARGNYAANAGAGYMFGPDFVRSYPWGLDRFCAGIPGTWYKRGIRGVMGANESVGVDGIPDGAAYTMLLGEVRAGVTEFDSRGVWAMSGGPSALWAHSYQGDDQGPNSPHPDGDDVIACSAIQATVGGIRALARLGMGCSYDDWANGQQTARSMHPGGVNAAMADGSVHWISDFVEFVPFGSNSNPPRTGVWDRLVLSADGQQIPADSF